MTIPFSKPAVDINTQLNILLARGLVVANQTLAVQALNSVGYYRLSGYLYPFRTRDASGLVLDTYYPGSTLDEVIQLYEFDRQLRLLLLDAIERIEVAVRTQVTYHFSLKYGPFGHTNPNNFHAKFRHNDWLNDAQTEVTRSNDKFISHFEQKYDGFPVVPLWMLTEVISIGSLSRLYRGLENSESVLLYGNKSISYIHTGPNEKVRQEIPLHQISTSIEFPSLQLLDPHNLDLQLRVFRVEGCHK